MGSLKIFFGVWTCKIFGSEKKKIFYFWGRTIVLVYFLKDFENFRGKKCEIFSGLVFLGRDWTLEKIFSKMDGGL